MKSLETKIPPPAVALVVGLAMWGISLVTPPIALPPAVHAAVSVVLAILAVAFSVAGVLSFRLARTTLNPTTVGAATTLVTSGIYRITRNPMYLGLMLALMAWAVFRSSASALLGPAGFVVYINRFQIEPEERALREIFGEQFTLYCTRVRRWL